MGRVRQSLCVFGLALMAFLGSYADTQAFPLNAALMVVSATGFILAGIPLVRMFMARAAVEAPVNWNPAGSVVGYIGVFTFAFGAWLLASSWDRNPIAFSDRELEGGGIALLGLVIVLVGRFVGRGRL